MDSLLARHGRHATLLTFVLAVPLLGGWEGCIPRPDDPPPPDDCVCTADYAPVCGDNGITYGNACAAECAGVPIAHDGECGGGGCREHTDCATGERCVYDALPLGADDEPRGAEPGAPDFCAPADCGGTYEGRCEACVCPEYFAPVCGEDGNTYGNPCEAECAHVGIAYDGECGGVPPGLCYSDADCAPEDFCAIFPTCGTDTGSGGGDEDGASPDEPVAPPLGECRPRECPAVLCDLYCEGGYATDERGCPTCACQPPPPPSCTSDAECAEGEICDVVCEDPCPPGYACGAPVYCSGTCVGVVEPEPAPVPPAAE
jgi:hypothetical protein